MCGRVVCVLSVVLSTDGGAVDTNRSFEAYVVVAAAVTIIGTFDGTTMCCCNCYCYCVIIGRFVALVWRVACGVRGAGRLFYSNGVGGKKRKGKETKKREELECVGGVKGRKLTRNWSVRTGRFALLIDIDINIYRSILIRIITMLVCVWFVCLYV